MLQLTGRFLLCALLAATISPLGADYVIDVKLIKYENYNRFLAHGGRCSGFKCETSITICAKPDDSSTMCQYGTEYTGPIGDNIIDLNNTYVGRLQNPITFLVNKPFERFLVSFTAKDKNQLIDEYDYRSTHNLPQGGIEEARYNMITTRGQYNSGSQLTYQIRSYCSQGYYGPNCLTRCDIPIAEQIRFMCDGKGQKVCKPGFSGLPFCNVNVDVCLSFPCKNDGTCNKYGTTFTCTCRPAYTGPYCIEGIDECKLTRHPCLNGGTCVDDIGRYHCLCPIGVTGDKCQNALSACSSSPCLNGGQCINTGSSTFKCCRPKFYGLRCNMQHLCNSLNCQNGGQCVTSNFIAKCVCQPGFTGQQCQISLNSCQSSPCQNGATCYPNGNQFTCMCKPGFTGQMCIQQLCAPNICQNNGNCHMVNDQIRCLCRGRFYGDRCQFRNQCYPPCQNGGICNGNPGKCNCPQGFGGPSCSIRDPCASRPCLNNGQCYVDNFYNYTCACASGWTGKNCGSSLMSCASSPCLNDGQCVPTGNTFICNCHQGWTGLKCQFQNSPCYPNPCLNNGQCNRLATNGFRCACTNGWYGQFCRQRNPNINCPTLPCRNGGTCIFNTNQIACQCPPGFNGIYCEVINPRMNFTCPEPTGLFSDPKSCRHFYQCDWSRAYHKDCPGNLHFNNVIKVCDWPHHADCYIRK